MKVSYASRWFSLILFGLLFYFLGCSSQSKINEKTVNIIPKPFHVEIGDGSFTINSDTKIFVEGKNDGIKNVAKYNFITNYYYFVMLAYLLTTLLYSELQY